MKQIFALFPIFFIVAGFSTSSWYVDQHSSISTFIISDTLTPLSYKEKIKNFSKDRKYDSAIYYSNKLLKLAHKTSDSILISKTNFRLGYYNLKSNNHQLSFSYYNDSYKIHLLLGDSISSASRLISMSNIQSRLGDYSGSIITALDALSLLNNSTDYNKITSVFQAISIAQKEQNDIKEALNWNNKIFQLLEKKTTEIKPINYIIYKNSHANILAAQEKYDESIAILKILLTDSLVVNSKTEQARILTNLARTKWLANPFNNESESLFLKALEIRKEINSISGLISSNTHLSKYYSKKNTKKALEYSLEALNNAKKLKNPVSILEILDLTIPLKTQLGLSLKEEASLYSKTQNKLTQTQQRIRSIYATTKYDNDKLANDNLILKAEKAQKERQNILYLSAFILSVLGIGFILYYKNQQNNQAKVEATYKTEIRLSKKIHDEVGNDIFYLMTQIKNQPELLKKDNGFIVLEGLDKVYQKARDISKEYTSINTDETFGEELIALLNSYGNDTIKIITNELDNSFWNSISKNKKLELFWIVRELMTNMRKYSKATFVGITFSKTRNHLEVKYNDNGVGFTKTKSNWGNGLKHVETRIQNLKGNLNFDLESSKGVTAKIKFPI